MQYFNAMATEKLGAYVYALSDPREKGALKDRIFYIGKGNGNRCFNHAQAERGRQDQPLNEGEHKLDTIRDIHSENRSVEVCIVAHGMDDIQAHALEAVLIPLLGGTNNIAGHGDRLLWLSTNQIDELYDKPIERHDVDLFRGNVLFVSLNRQDTNALLQRDAVPQLEEATLGAWNLGEAHSKTVDCVVGVKNGLIISIFKTEKNSEGVTRFERYPPKKPRAHGRSRFYGTPVPELEHKLRARSVFEDDRMLSKVRPGAGCQFFPAMKAATANK